MQDASPGPETTGRHRRPQVISSRPPVPPARHRAVELVALPEPEAPVRRRHAAPDRPAANATPPRRRHGALDSGPRSHSRIPHRTLAGLALLAIAGAPMLSRSASALGLHDAVAAQIAASPSQATETLDALRRGGIMAGSVTATRAPLTTAPSSFSAAVSAPGSATASTVAGPAGSVAPTGEVPAAPVADGTTSAPADGDSSPLATTGNGTTTEESIPTTSTPTTSTPTTAEPTESAPTTAQPTESAPITAQPTESAPTTPEPTEPTEPTPTEAEVTDPDEPDDAAAQSVAPAALTCGILPAEICGILPG